MNISKKTQQSNLPLLQGQPKTPAKNNPTPKTGPITIDERTVEQLQQELTASKQKIKMLEQRLSTYEHSSSTPQKKGQPPFAPKIDQRKLTAQEVHDQDKVIETFKIQKKDIYILIDTLTQRIAQIRPPYETALSKLTQATNLFESITSNTSTAATLLIEAILQKKETQDAFKNVEKIKTFLDQVDIIKNGENGTVNNGKLQKIKDNLTFFSKSQNLINNNLIGNNKEIIKSLTSLISSIENELQCKKYLRALTTEINTSEKPSLKTQAIAGLLAKEAVEKSSNLKTADTANLDNLAKLNVEFADLLFEEINHQMKIISSLYIKIYHDIINNLDFSSDNVFNESRMALLLFLNKHQIEFNTLKSKFKTSRSIYINQSRNRSIDMTAIQDEFKSFLNELESFLIKLTPEEANKNLLKNLQNIEEESQPLTTQEIREVSSIVNIIKTKFYSILKELTMTKIMVVLASALVWDIVYDTKIFSSIVVHLIIFFFFLAIPPLAMAVFVKDHPFLTIATISILALAYKKGLLSKFIDTLKYLGRNTYIPNPEIEGLYAEATDIFEEYRRIQQENHAKEIEKMNAKLLLLKRYQGPNLSSYV